MLSYLASRCFQHNTFSLPLRVKINVGTILLGLIFWVHFQNLQVYKLAIRVQFYQNINYDNQVKTPKKPNSIVSLTDQAWKIIKRLKAQDHKILSSRQLKNDMVRLTSTFRRCKYTLSQKRNIS